NRTEPQWKAYVAHPSAPPEGIEGFPAVQARSVAVVEELRSDDSLGAYVVLVAHADVVKLILAYYTGTPVDCALFTSIANASISALLFADDSQPHLLAVNWTPFPGWLTPFPIAKLSQTEQQTPGGAEPTRPAPSESSPSAEAATAASTPSEQS